MDLFRSSRKASYVAGLLCLLAGVLVGRAVEISVPTAPPDESHHSPRLAATCDHGARAYLVVENVRVPSSPELSRRKPSGNPEVRILSIWEAASDGQHTTPPVLVRHAEASGPPGESAPLRYFLCTFLL